MTMGERFQAIRLEKGKTVAQLQEETGIEENRIVEFEKTGGELTLGELCVLARDMDSPLYYITHDQDDHLLKASSK